MKVRAKFKCDAKREMMTSRFDPVSKTSVPAKMVSIEMSPVYGNGDPNHENTKFWKASPSGSLSLGCVIQEVADQFELGQEYYLDFSTPAEPVEAEPVEEDAPVAGEAQAEAVDPGPSREEAMPVVFGLLRRVRLRVVHGLVDRGFNVQEAMTVANAIGDGTLLKLIFEHMGDILALIEAIAKMFGK